MSDLGIVRVAAASPKLKIANPVFNSSEIIKLIEEADANGAGIILFPELALTGSTAADLLRQPILYERQLECLAKIVESSKNFKAAAIIGFLLKLGSSAITCSAVVKSGKLCGIVPKCSCCDTPDTVSVFGEDIPFGSLVFGDAESSLRFTVNAECPGNALIVFLPSADAETAGGDAIRKAFLSSESERYSAGYVYASAGIYESTTDAVFSGSRLVYECGELIAESERFEFDSAVTFADIDYGRLGFMREAHECECTCGCSDSKAVTLDTLRIITTSDKLIRKYDPKPFTTSDKTVSDSRCKDIFSIQSVALARRLGCINAKTSVIGISGGLDSTLALLAAVRGCKLLGKPASDVIAVTMPGFGTTGATYGNALKMMQLLGCTIREIPIVPAVRQHFSDIGQDEANHDLTYENAQARERTQILMDIAGMNGGLVVGTGDLSELALGWCTYNGDHMSMYGVNAGIPKTTVRAVVRWVIENVLTEGGESFDPSFSSDNALLAKTLLAVLDTPISPELLPPEKDGSIAQKTEDKVGPYELHDFFIYHTLADGWAPEKLVYIAKHVFAGTFDEETIKKWAKTFLRRFFTQQFKRSCSPDGPKVFPISLSPRGGLDMPSDADSSIWLDL